MIEIELQLPLDRFALEVSWKTTERAVGIFGPSGSGKTTILEAVAGLRPRARGAIRVDGDTWLDSARGIHLAPERRGVGYVPQNALLFPHRDVLGNLLSGSRRAGHEPSGGANATPAGGEATTPAGSRQAVVDRIVEVLELAPLLHRDVLSLSGGEKQRVALGRALASAPRLLLLDEPLAGLDAPLRGRILPYLLRVREEFSVPSIFVSHHPTEIALMCREVLVLDRGKGRLAGNPAEVFLRPELLVSPPSGGLGEDARNVLRGRVGGSRRDSRISRSLRESGFWSRPRARSRKGGLRRAACRRPHVVGEAARGVVGAERSSRFDT